MCDWRHAHGTGCLGYKTLFSRNGLNYLYSYHGVASITIVVIYICAGIVVVRVSIGIVNVSKPKILKF